MSTIAGSSNLPRRAALPSVFRFFGFGIAAAWLCLCNLSLSAAQDTSKYQVKAAYLYTFAKMAEWPADVVPQSDSPLAICVFGGSEDFVQVLRATLAGKTIDSHPIAIKYVPYPADLKLCHLAFFRESEAATQPAILTLDRAAVLLVGEEPDFLAYGGMVNLLLKDGKLSYEINPDALTRGNLRFGSPGTAPLRPASGAPAMQGRQDRALKFQATPTYPEIAKRMQLKGVVQLMITVRADGKVTDVVIIGGHPLLASAAVQAVTQWRFEPAARESIETVRISFDH
ncbi:MAG TPA: TonB family protein [Terriglobales bacterium]